MTTDGVLGLPVGPDHLVEQALAEGGVHPGELHVPVLSLVTVLVEVIGGEPRQGVLHLVYEEVELVGSDHREERRVRDTMPPLRRRGCRRARRVVGPTY